ncbi:hypothetical protein [Gracilibacillus salinarum]|uniref:Uncharacterized protein n=1 Tax=Gracilibacillus salinarum TaxID=2932255 RepID=A0ABY4GRT3_9BACI|nr:hypothetical protein [Gracilibacillus salinarum]UOQ86372.1 hypothetical protein MUN87_05665 [Gracilibacillus salinarum]
MMLQIILIIAMIVSFVYTVRQRKKASITGFKTYLTPLCFQLNAVVYLCAYWFDVIGIISWMLMIFLFLLAAYFMKYSAAVTSSES